ncbi:hypothetical protein Tco_0205877 [Tanacetum coccineum]
MSSITAQQTKLDLELVPKEKRLDIGKCNGRLNPGKIQREPTFQVVLDALALTPCYSAFLITTGVPKVYLHQFWDSVYKHDAFYRFKIDKRKRFKLTLEVFRDIFKIYPRVQGQDFDALPTDEEIVSFLRDLGHTREIHSLNEDNSQSSKRAENAKIKQHYKELYDSIKITVLSSTNHHCPKKENESLKVQLQNTVSCVTTNQVKPKVLAPGKYAIDVEPIPPRNRNNREVHLVYLRHLKESVDTLREIVEEAKVERPLDRSLAFVLPLTLKHLMNY